MVDKETVSKVAKIARLDLSGEEIESFTKELDEIEKAFLLIKEIDTSDTQPSFHAIPIKNKFREDKLEDSFSQETALGNAEQKENGYFKGPKVV
jgi:aspartyl-tRNA(Asn)/glutamyl-tRNA(Gln) amidotransferase subunit C